MSPESRQGYLTVTQSRLLDNSVAKKNMSQYKSGMQGDSMMAQSVGAVKDSRLHYLHETKLKEMADFLF